MKDDKKQPTGKLQPTSEFTNQKPPHVNTWHKVFYHFKDQYKSIEEFPPRLQWDFIKANRKLDVYYFDFEFLKARVFEEAYPMVSDFLNTVAGGKNYPTWTELVRKFYNDYQTKVIEGK